MASLSNAKDSERMKTPRPAPVADTSTPSPAEVSAAARAASARLFNRRRSSGGEGMNNATATLRVSVSSAVNTHGKERHAMEKSRRLSAEQAKKSRRRSSLAQMGVANEGIRDLVSSVLQQEAAADAGSSDSPIQKLQALLTKAKERGMSAERVFEHFAPNGESSVTPAMFEAALRGLSQRAYDLDELELEHLLSTLDTNGNGTIEVDDFMAFCLSIPSLPWRAEKVRRLSNAESKDDLNIAARKIARRRSSLRAISIGHLLHQGSRFFWRSKETIDVAFHYNWDDELITISTRCLERGHNYPAIFVDASKLPITKSEAIARANSIGQFEAMTEEERREAIETAKGVLRVEYLQHRLKVPDEVNGHVDANVSDDSAGSSTSSRTDQEATNGMGTLKAATSARANGAAPANVSEGRGGEGAEMTPKERSKEKAKHRPFLAKLSTDEWDTLLCVRNIVLQTPHRFERTGRRSSMQDFRRTSLEFAQLAKETEKLSNVADGKARALKDSIEDLATAGPGNATSRTR